MIDGREIRVLLLYMLSVQVQCPFFQCISTSLGLTADLGYGGLKQSCL